jgi:hypothetical protein
VRLEISSILRISVNELPVPASRSGRIEKVLGNRRTCDKIAPGQSRDVLADRVRRTALGILHECSVDPIRFVLAGRRRPRESAAGGNKTTLAGLVGDRSRNKRHEAGRHMGRLRGVDRVRRGREQFNRHGKPIRQLSIYRQFRLISPEHAVCAGVFRGAEGNGTNTKPILLVTLQVNEIASEHSILVPESEVFSPNRLVRRGALVQHRATRSSPPEFGPKQVSFHAATELTSISCLGGKVG